MVLSTVNFPQSEDREIAVSGKRVDLGGGRIIKKLTFVMFAGPSPVNAGAVWAPPLEVILGDVVPEV